MFFAKIVVLLHIKPKPPTHYYYFNEKQTKIPSYRGCYELL
jgi:hypothetical protein